MPIKHLKVNRYRTNYTKKILNGGSKPQKQPRGLGIKSRRNPSRTAFKKNKFPVVLSGVSGVSGGIPHPHNPKLTGIQYSVLKNTVQSSMIKTNLIPNKQNTQKKIIGFLSSRQRSTKA